MNSFLVAISMLTLALRPVPTPDQTAVMASINVFLDAFNKGDEKAALASCSDIIAIVDEFPPYEWHGAGTCASWMAAYDADAKQKEITEPAVAFGTPRHLDITGDRAYVVLPAQYTFMMKGKPVKQSASTITLSLRKMSSGWRMTAWTWSKE